MKSLKNLLIPFTSLVMAVSTAFISSAETISLSDSRNNDISESSITSYYGSGNERNDLNLENDIEFDEDMLSIISEKEVALCQKIAYPSKCILSLSWQQQENNYYCGPATASMILSRTNANTPTQDQIAESTYLGTDTNGTPWYSGGANPTASPNYYNMMRGLNRWQYNQMGRYDWNYTVYPYNTVATDTGYIDRIKYTIYMGYAVALNGNSSGVSSDLSHLPNYPNFAVGHWLVCYGWNDDNYYFADPAAGITSFENVHHYYTVKEEKMLSFISNGIVY